MFVDGEQFQPSKDLQQPKQAAGRAAIDGRAPSEDYDRLEEAN